MKEEWNENHFSRRPTSKKIRLPILNPLIPLFFYGLVKI